MNVLLMYLLLPPVSGGNRHPGPDCTTHFILEEIGYSLCGSPAGSKREGHAYTFPASTTSLLSDKKIMTLAEKIAIPEDRNSQPRWSFPIHHSKENFSL